MTTVSLSDPTAARGERHLREVPAFPQMARAITPSDADNFDRPVSIYVGGAGVVAVIPWGDQENPSPTVVTFTMPAGSVVPVEVWKVMATDTTATLLVGVY